jgi:rubrerythrin
MLKIRSDIVPSIRQAKGAGALHQYLQCAIELEHSTIPPYLQALYSIKHDKNRIIADLIRSIVIEEMLHMAIVANVLNAIGGEPAINKQGFVPTYPGPLPMNVHGGLAVGLAPLSKRLIHDVFMEIEMPEDPKNFPIKSMALTGETFATIGTFYAAIIDKLNEFGDRAFIGKPERQVVDNTWFPPAQLFPIRDVESAVRGLNIIVQQGEGTSDSPLEAVGQPAHYYRFAEIFNGRRLVPDPTVEKKYSYSGAPIPFDTKGIWDMVINPKVENYSVGSTARAYAERFNHIYSNLLNSLHSTFNGEPPHLRAAIGGMYELRLAAEALIEIPDATTGKQAAPTFEYAVENASSGVVTRSSRAET